MAVRKEAQERESGRIVLFPTRKGKALRKDAGKVPESEVQDLRKYEHDAEPDDYPRRMIINLAAFSVIVVLTLAGIWLADQIASLRKHQDCALSGRKNCVDIDAQIRNH